TASLRKKYPESEIVGFDSGFFASCVLDRNKFPESQIDKQYFGDVRDFPSEILRGVDAVVHLAAISNDPMGKEFEKVTDDINYRQTIDIAKKAKEAGVKNFVFASSCSVYGFASDYPKTEKDEVNPLTAYAKSKIDSENSLKELADGDYIITCLRFATACGMSPRLRLDLVLNDFVASALSLGKISILSDGTPWRPLIDVHDMYRAIDWAARRKSDNGGSFLVVNTGFNDGNYMVKQLAEAVKEQLPDTTIEINTNAAPDKRSYKVDFSLFQSLAPDFQPEYDLKKSISSLIEGLQKTRFNDGNFRNSYLIRLNVLKDLKAEQILDENLFFNN
ncbi:MAG TPA: SDR family oxidoreductase, partial [Segetibacter sp.]